jgi:hypothetical protein
MTMKHHIKITAIGLLAFALDVGAVYLAAWAATAIAGTGADFWTVFACLIVVTLAGENIKWAYLSFGRRN